MQCFQVGLISSCMSPAIVFRCSQNGLPIFECKNTLWISNCLPEVKQSVSHAHSTYLMYYALIPVNSLARVDVHMLEIRATQSQA